MDNIINHERLNAEEPEWRNLELQYRTCPIDTRSDAGLALSTLLMLSLASFIAMIVVRVLGGNFLQPQGILFCTGIGFFFAFVTILADRKAVRRAALILLCAPFVSFLIGLLHYATLSVPLNALLTFVALLVAVWLVDHIVHHYAAWMLANPNLPREARMARTDWYNRRRWPLGITKDMRLDTSDKELQNVRTAELRRIRSYPRGFFVIALLYAMLPHLPKGAYPDGWILFVPPVYALFRIWRTSPSRDFRAGLRASLRAFICWLTYGHQATDAPGVFQSPYGTLKNRTFVTALVFSVLALVISPYIGYFSFFKAVAGNDYHWNSQFDLSIRQQSSFVGTLLAVATGGQFNLNPLTEEETELLRQLREPVFTPLRKSDQELKSKLEYKLSVGQSNIYDSFNRRFPLGWVFIALDAVMRGQTVYLYPLTLALVACVLFPFLVLWSLLAAAGAGLLAHTRLAVDDANAPECREPKGQETALWNKYVSRLQNSLNKKEAAHLWLGSHIEEDYPVLLDREILSEHAYIVGDSGSGKTTLGIIPMLVQIIRAKHAGIVIIDLKGDNALFQTVREEARNAGLTFKFFTNEMKKPTYSFNPFLQANPEHISLNQVCETMLEALNLNHGEGYGRSYFSRVARRWLSAILKSQSSIKSFDDLYQFTRGDEYFKDPKERQDAFELIAVIESLASFQQLNIAPSISSASQTVLENAIHMPDVIAEKQIAYFWLPAAIESASVREIAKLAIYSLLNSAYWHRRTLESDLQTYLVIDEFQRIASDNFKIVLEQARSMGIGAILANQTFADLQTNDTDLRPTVQTNTRFKQIFSATDPEQQLFLMAASGERISYRYSFSKSSSGSSSVSASEVTLPRLQRNHVIEISDNPLASIVHISRGKGYSQFKGYMVPVRVGYCMTKDQYDRLMARPWPEASDHTLTVARPPLEADAFPSAERRLEAAKVVLDLSAKSTRKTPSKEENAAPAGQRDWAAELQVLAEAKNKQMEELRALQKARSEEQE